MLEPCALLDVFTAAIKLLVAVLALHAAFAKKSPRKRN